MNLRQLKYFVRVIETANMTRAADELRIAQPALGMQIKQLEEGLGVTLLTRHSRGVSPTAAGEKLFQRAIETSSSSRAGKCATTRAKPSGSA